MDLNICYKVSVKGSFIFKQEQNYDFCLCLRNIYEISRSPPDNVLVEITVQDLFHPSLLYGPGGSDIVLDPRLQNGNNKNTETAFLSCLVYMDITLCYLQCKKHSHFP